MKHASRITTATRTFAMCESNDSTRPLTPKRFVNENEPVTCPACLKVMRERQAKEDATILQLLKNGTRLIR